jgi:hypothetical protein
LYIESLLDLPAASLKVYPVYTVVSEKFQAMISLGVANSRMKDFYDIMVVARTVELNGGLLARAIRATFERRETAFDRELPAIFEDAFANDRNKQLQWSAFLKKNSLNETLSFDQLMVMLTGFLSPPYRHARDGSHWDQQWSMQKQIWV